MVFFHFFKDESFEFEQTYDYFPENFIIHSEKTDELEGRVSFHGEVYWDSSAEVFEYELYHSGSHIKLETTSFPGYDELENRFLEDYKEYLLSQEIPSENIGWL